MVYLTKTLSGTPAAWQLGVTEYVLTVVRISLIFQLQNDYSRLAVASHMADKEIS